MSTTTELMDLARAATASVSDAELARKVGLKPAALSNYRQGTRHADEETIEALCKAAGEKPTRWAMLIQADRQKTESARRFWQKLAQVAAVMTLAVAVLPAHAAVRAASSCAHNPVSLYIMSNVVRAFRRVGTWIASLCTPCIGRFGHAV